MDEASQMSSAVRNFNPITNASITSCHSRSGRHTPGKGREERRRSGATKERVDAGAASRERAASRRGASTRLQRLNL